jgi:hypothetical protein
LLAALAIAAFYGGVIVWGDGKSDPASVKGEVNIQPERFDPDLRERFTSFYRKALSRDFRARYDNPGEMLDAWNEIFRNVDERRKTQTSHPEMEERDDPRRTRGEHPLRPGLRLR